MFLRLVLEKDRALEERCCFVVSGGMGDASCFSGGSTLVSYLRFLGGWVSHCLVSWNGCKLVWFGLGLVEGKWGKSPGRITKNHKNRRFKSPTRGCPWPLGGYNLDLPTGVRTKTFDVGI